MSERYEDLLERVAELADQFACGAAGEPVVYALHGPTDFAEEVIALVTEARDAVIREALLSSRDVEDAAYRELRESGDAYFVLERALEAAGLTEQEAEG